MFLPLKSYPPGREYKVGINIFMIGIFSKLPRKWRNIPLIPTGAPAFAAGISVHVKYGRRNPLHACAHNSIRADVYKHTIEQSRELVTVRKATCDVGFRRHGVVYQESWDRIVPRPTTTHDLFYRRHVHAAEAHSIDQQRYGLLVVHRTHPYRFLVAFILLCVNNGSRPINAAR